MSLHDVRRDYSGDLLPENLDGFDPWAFFGTWMEAALASEDAEPTAMTVSTVDQDGVPRARVVLLKEYSPSGLTFFTSHLSAKGRELDAHPAVCASFWWPAIMRQVRAVGAASRLERDTVEAYFATRPRSSQIGAWASRQSAPLPSRAELDAARAEAEERFAGRDVECPPYWGGYLIDVTEFEFWQGLPGRIHDRVLAQRAGDAWRAGRLQP